MDVIHYLPPSSELNAEAFKRWGSDENSIRLGISAPHTVTGEVGAATIEGSADVIYVVEARKKYDSLAGDVDIKNHTQYVGTQSPDVIRSLMEELRPRTSYAVHTTVNGVFDLRGLMFVCGRVAAGGAANGEFEYGRAASQTRLLSPTWTVPIAGELVIGPGVATTQNEYATLAYMTRAAGMRTVQLMADLLPPEGRPLQGLELSAFGLKIGAAILAVAQGCACGTHHLQAFYCGMVSAWKLWSHTDEGGWLRKALSKPRYPPGAGIISVTQSEFIGLPLRQRMHGTETTRAAMALFLTLAMTVPVADAYMTGMPTVVSRSEAGAGRPSEYEGLIDLTYSVMHTWRFLIAKKFNLHESSLGDGHTLGPYFEENKVDKHFASVNVMPFWTNEPSPVYLGETGGLEMPMKRGERVVLPLFGAESTGHRVQDELYDGRLSRGAKALATLPPGNLRMLGYSYLLSGSYSPLNGLSFIEYVQDFDTGIVTTDAAFVEEGVTNAAERRWITPHNPVASPMEGYRNERSAIEYSYAGRRSDPKLSDFENAKVHSSVGPFFLSDPVMSAIRTHKFVPKRYVNVLKSFETTYDPKQALTRRFFNEGNVNPILQGRVVQPPTKEEPEVTPLPSTTPITHTEPSTGPPSLPPGPVTQINLAADSGLKQPSKTASYAARDQGDSAKSTPGGD